MKPAPSVRQSVRQSDKVLKLPTIRFFWFLLSAEESIWTGLRFCVSVAKNPKLHLCFWAIYLCCQRLKWWIFPDISLWTWYFHIFYTSVSERHIVSVARYVLVTLGSEWEWRNEYRLQTKSLVTTKPFGFEHDFRVQSPGRSLSSRSVVIPGREQK